MKNIVKTALMAVIVLSIAACDPPKKINNGPDSASATTQIDSTVKTSVDSTAKADIAKKDTAKL